MDKNLIKQAFLAGYKAGLEKLAQRFAPQRGVVMPQPATNLNAPPTPAPKLNPRRPGPVPKPFVRPPMATPRPSPFPQTSKAGTLTSVQTAPTKTTGVVASNPYAYPVRY